MDWTAIGAIGEVLGAIAVIGTLFYLARQIAHSVDLARASQNKGLMDSYAQLNNMIVTEPQLRALLVLMEEPAADLDREQTVTARHFAYRMCNIYNSAQSAFDSHQISEAEFAFYEEDLRTWARLYPGLAEQMAQVLRDYPRAGEWRIYASLQ